MKKQTSITFAALTAFAVFFALSLPATAQNAAATFKAKCAGCHGVDGKGTTGLGKALGVHDFSSDQVDADLTTIVTTGRNKMPAYGKSLKEAEIKDLVAYVHQLGMQK
jgi:mono/diheme cytochrome c family protein